MKRKKKDRAKLHESAKSAETETVDMNDQVKTEEQAAGSTPETEETVQDVSAAEEVAEELSSEETLKRQLEEANDKLLRNAAEFDNYRKRMARQMENMIGSANDSIIGSFLEVLDNFERALAHDNNNSDDAAFRQGIEMILNQMTDLLKRYNVAPIEALGQPFDPNLHEAMMPVDSDEYEDGLVALEISKGYRLGERVIRHSRVGVSTGPKAADEVAEEK